MSDPVIRSPCVGICELDSTGHCRGCRRTLEEIAGWIRYSTAERNAIMSELGGRPVDGTPADGGPPTEPIRAGARLDVWWAGSGS